MFELHKKLDGLKYLHDLMYLRHVGEGVGGVEVGLEGGVVGVGVEGGVGVGVEEGVGG